MFQKRLPRTTSTRRRELVLVLVPVWISSRSSDYTVAIRQDARRAGLHLYEYSYSYEYQQQLLRAEKRPTGYRTSPFPGLHRT
eukprot:scaffold285382_cov46-Prasinocladus_malaysianus.AAC.1